MTYEDVTLSPAWT